MPLAYPVLGPHLLLLDTHCLSLEAACHIIQALRLTCDAFQICVAVCGGVEHGGAESIVARCICGVVYVGHSVWYYSVCVLECV